MISHCYIRPCSICFCRAWCYMQHNSLLLHSSRAQQSLLSQHLEFCIIASSCHHFAALSKHIQGTTVANLGVITRSSSTYLLLLFLRAMEFSLRWMTLPTVFNAFLIARHYPFKLVWLHHIAELRKSCFVLAYDRMLLWLCLLSWKCCNLFSQCHKYTNDVLRITFLGFSIVLNSKNNNLLPYIRFFEQKKN